MNFAACLTPAGRSALATVAVAGPDAWNIATRFFRPRGVQSIPTAPVEGQFWLGSIGMDMVDEGILACLQPGRIEFHLHGNPEVVRLLLEQLELQGIQICSWSEFQEKTSESVLRGSAQFALSQTVTLRTAAILLDQEQGAFENAWNSIQNLLHRGLHQEAKHQLNELARWIPLGLHLTTPWRVVIAGAPNVGKSSLVNGLAGYQRSLVSSIPGTTRDVVSTRLAIDGWPIELIDTAGIRIAEETLESQGIERAREAFDQADLILWIVDGSSPPIWPHSFDPKRYRFLRNKIDLPKAWHSENHQVDAELSTQSGEGIPGLCSLLARWLVPEIPPPGAAIPFTSQLAREVEHALVQTGQTIISPGNGN